MRVRVVLEPPVTEDAASTHTLVELITDNAGGDPKRSLGFVAGVLITISSYYDEATPVHGDVRLLFDGDEMPIGEPSRAASPPIKQTEPTPEPQPSNGAINQARPRGTPRPHPFFMF